MTENEEKRVKLPLWSALFSYVIGTLWVYSFISYLHSGAWRVLFFAAVYFGWAELTLHSRKGSKEHFIWLICAAFIAACMFAGRLRAVDMWGYLALHAFAAYWALCRGGMLTEGESGVFLPVDGFLALVVYPFGGLFRRILTIVSGIKDLTFKLLSARGTSHNWKRVLIFILFIVVVAPLLLLACSLLMQADAAFENFAAKFSEYIRFEWESPDWLNELFVHFLFGVPVGAYLFGLMGSILSREQSQNNANYLRQYCGKMRFAPDNAVLIVLLAFIALYLVYFGVQAGVLFGAFFGIIPGELTAAQYAREGFFQLCRVMLINFAVLAIAALAAETNLRKSRKLKIAALVLIAESFLLSVTAASRLLLYIERFGFTPLRLLSMWGIIVLAVGCIFSASAVLHRGRQARNWIYFTAVSFTLLCAY